MSVNAAIIVSAILDLAALGGLGLVCRSPFRAENARREMSTPSQPPVSRDEQLAA